MARPSTIQGSRGTRATAIGYARPTRQATSVFTRTWRARAPSSSDGRTADLLGAQAGWLAFLLAREDRAETFAVTGADCRERETDLVPAGRPKRQLGDPGDDDPAGHARSVEQEDLGMQRITLAGRLVAEDANACRGLAGRPLLEPPGEVGACEVNRRLQARVHLPFDVVVLLHPVTR